MRLPFAFMPMGLLQYIQSKIALHRLQRYLGLPELGSYVEKTAPPPQDGADDRTSPPTSGSIFIRNGTFTWIDPDGPEIKPIQDEPPKKASQRRASRRSQRREASNKASPDHEIGNDEDDQSINHNADGTTHSLATSVISEEGSKSGIPTITLQDISCDIEPGSLVAVVGPVGSGKSSFLSAILGEMEAVNGSKVYIPQSETEQDMHGFASYCTQSPWVIDDTLRGNILFGREMDTERYEQVLECCALLDDIAVLPAGDMTEIGVRFVILLHPERCDWAFSSSQFSHIRLLYPLCWTGTWHQPFRRSKGSCCFSTCRVL
jgi:ABC-type multidrug transport system fused ATPase/permease subunit